MGDQEKYKRNIRGMYRFLIVLCVLFVVFAIIAIYFFKDGVISADDDKKESYTIISADEDPDKIENGIHVRTGLIDAEGLTTVVQNCTTCHSAQLVIQNKMSREKWASTIRWMQETQNLWDLGANEAIIIDYLVTNYPPKKTGRREVLTNIEWYELKE